MRRRRGSRRGWRGNRRSAPPAADADGASDDAQRHSANRSGRPGGRPIVRAAADGVRPAPVQGNELAIVRKLASRLVPTLPTAATMTSAMNEAIRAYSIEVAPSRDLRYPNANPIIGPGPWSTEPQ